MGWDTGAGCAVVAQGSSSDGLSAGVARALHRIEASAVGSRVAATS